MGNGKFSQESIGALVNRTFDMFAHKPTPLNNNGIRTHYGEATVASFSIRPSRTLSWWNNFENEAVLGEEW